MIKKAKCYYEQSKHRKEPLKDWKRKDKPIFHRNGFNPSQYKNMKGGYQFGHLTRSMHQQNFPSRSGNRPIEKVREKVAEKKKGPIQCWGCGGEHMLRYCPHIQHGIKKV